MSLSARSVFVTGASRGIGLEFVKQILKLPSAPEVIIAGCRNPATASSLHELAKTNSRVKIVKLDVEKDDDIENAKKETEALVGDLGLGLLINNAGINDKSTGGRLKVQTRDLMQRHYNINVSSPILVTQKFLPLLEQAAIQNKNAPMSTSKAAVVFISSQLGSQDLAFQQKYGSLHYNCSKSALNMATILIASDLQEPGILVMGLHPGWLSSDMGGPQAPLSVEEGVADCISVMGIANEKHHGRLTDHKGGIMQF